MAPDDLAGEHRHVPWTPLLWLPLIVVVGKVMSSKVDGHERWTWLHWAILVALVLAAQLLTMLVLRRRVTITPAAIEQRGFLLRRSLRWDAVRSIHYKSGGMFRGHQQSDKIILRGPGSKIFVTSEYGDFAALKRRIDTALVAARGPSLTEAIAADGKSWRGWIYIPHLEDLGPSLLTLAALAGAFYGAMCLAQTPWFLALATPRF